MEINYKKRQNFLFIYLEGELDHHQAKQAMERIGQIMCLHMDCNIILDFDKIRFMDSSGIAVAMNAWNNAKRQNAQFAIQNVPDYAFKVFQAAGMDQILTILPKKKEETSC
jgi:stage II sporulation protein AA (anti-sigma F factor antagonist)